MDYMEQRVANLERIIAEQATEIATLRASAEIAVGRWRRSEAIRKAAIDQACDQSLYIEELEQELTNLDPAGWLVRLERGRAGSDPYHEESKEES